MHPRAFKALDDHRSAEAQAQERKKRVLRRKAADDMYYALREVRHFFGLTAIERYVRDKIERAIAKADGELEE